MYKEDCLFREKIWSKCIWTSPVLFTSILNVAHEKLMKDIMSICLYCHASGPHADSFLPAYYISNITRDKGEEKYQVL
jgi:hypothetical protein